VKRTPVVFIHGAWFHTSSWDDWAERFTAHGYAVHVPRWPGEADSAAEDRRHPDPRQDLGLDTLIGHYEFFVSSLDNPPVLIGHSLGGLMARHLISVGLGRAAVALAPWPDQSMRSEEVKTSLWSLAPRGSADRQGFAPLPRSHFRHAVANTVGEEEAAQLFERHVVPAPRRLLTDLEVTGGPADAFRTARIVVDTADATRGPLLLISGQEDRVVPDAATRAVYKAYGDTTAVTDLKQFADRGHSLAIDSGWRTVADHVLAWLTANGVAAITAED
jgi:alpha-beta hydrolase superfamily lysophospholipase